MTVFMFHTPLIVVFILQLGGNYDSVLTLPHKLGNKNDIRYTDFTLGSFSMLIIFVACKVVLSSFANIERTELQKTCTFVLHISFCTAI